MKKQLLKTTDIEKKINIIDCTLVINELRQEIANAIYMKRLVEEYFNEPNSNPSDWIAGEKLTDFEKDTFIYACNLKTQTGA
jgi:hypothetical protein